MRGILVLVLLFAWAPIAHASSGFAFGAERGPHAVGVSVVHQYDFVRAYRGGADPVTGELTTGERARPIQTVVWYPAIAGGDPLRFKDYLRLSATEEVFDRTEAEIAEAAGQLISVRTVGLSPEMAWVQVERPMWAVRDAAPAAGRFPVVIYAPSFGAPAYENADLCEYLASLGYVVIASPSMGQRTRGMTDDQAGLEAQAGDIGFLIAYARSLPQADTDRLAVAGFSWGGLSNIFAAAKDIRIDALISLDGSVRYFPKLIEDAGYVTPARVTAPFLLLAARPMPLEDTPPDMPNRSSSFINRMVYADVHRVTMSQMDHGHFAAWQIALSPDAAFTDYSRDEVSASYHWAVRYAARFLDAHLKDDAEARAFLARSPMENGVPAHLMSVNTRMASGSPPTRESMAAQLARRGFAAIPEVHAEFLARDAAFQISEPDLNTWGYQLLALDRVDDAISVFKLMTSLHPASGNAFDSLGEAYAIKGERDLAILNYRKSLVLDPSNANGLARLAALGVTVP